MSPFPALSNFAAPLAGTVSANLQSQATANQQKTQFALQSIALQRQAREDKIANDLKIQQGLSAGARAAHLGAMDANPKPPEHQIDPVSGKIYERDPVTGAWNAATMGGSAAPTATASGPPSAIPPSAMGGGTTMPPQGGVNTETPVPPVAADTGAPPRFGKAPVVPKIDPFSAQGIAGKKELQANAARLRPPPNQPLVKTVGPDGKVTYTSANQAAGMAAPTPGAAASANAQVMSKEGQFGEMLKKAGDIFDASDKMDVSVGQSAANDIAQHGVGIGGLRIPGTQGVGSLMLNKTPAYATYQAALDPFVLANAHALSGARINQEQADMIKRSIERKPGDLANPQVTKQKEKNIVDQMNSVAATLSPDAVAAQEAQMDPNVLGALRARGYKGASIARGGRGGQPSVTGARDVPGNIDLSAPTPHVTPAERTALKAQGFSDAQIDAYKP